MIIALMVIFTILTLVMLFIVASSFLEEYDTHDDDILIGVITVILAILFITVIYQLNEYRILDEKYITAKTKTLK